MSDVEQWEHDEQRAMETEIVTLREQVEKLKAELKSIDGALNNPRANLTLTTAEIIWELKAQNEKMREALAECEQALDECRDYPVTLDLVIEALSLPDLMPSALNRIKAEAYRELVSVFRNEGRDEVFVDRIEDEADALEKENL